MIVESPTTHSNLDGPISAKFHTRIRSTCSAISDGRAQSCPKFLGMDDMIRQNPFYLSKWKEAAGPRRWLTLQSEGGFSVAAEERFETSGDAVVAQP